MDPRCSDADAVDWRCADGGPIVVILQHLKPRARTREPENYHDREQHLGSEKVF